MFVYKNLIKLTTVILVALFFIGFSSLELKAQRFAEIFDRMDRVTSGADSTHDIYFSSANGISSGGTITITFPSAFIFDVLYDYTDMLLQEGSSSNCQTASFTNKALSNSPSGLTWGVSKSANTVITITSGTDTITANRCIRVFFDVSNFSLTNPTITSNTVYNINVDTQSESGQLAVIVLGDASAINVDQINLNASVATSILMGIDTVTSNCNNNTQTTPANQVVNFEQLLPGILKLSGTSIPYICIEAGTNSLNGFRILVQSSRSNAVGGLVSSGGTIVSATADLNSTSSGYGLRVSSLGTPTIGSLSSTSPYNSATAGSVGQINGSSGTAAQIITSSAPVRSGNTARIAIEVSAKSDTSTPAGSYTDTLTFTAFTNL
jgi:hypothetical protein